MKNKKIQCKEFYVEGMHCAACEILVEKKLSKHDSVSKVNASLKDQKITIEGDFDNQQDLNKLAQELTEFVEKDGYRVMTERPEDETSHLGDFIYAIPAGLLVIFIFILLQKMGIINFVNSNDKNLAYPVIFLIGIVASLSSCMAVVGGLVLSMAATYAKESRTGRNVSQVSFHVSRILSFFVLGGVLGVLGASFKISSSIYFVLDLVIAFVMIVLAFNMMDIFPFFKKFQPRMPKFISKKALNLENSNRGNIITPLLVGAATFFLPCGFTQSMQLYALGTGNFFSGAVTMIVFALGTLPVLALISFASLTFSMTGKSRIFFKAAGIIVLFFALINLLGALSIIGIIPPVLNI